MPNTQNPVTSGVGVDPLTTNPPPSLVVPGGGAVDPLGGITPPPGLVPVGPATPGYPGGVPAAPAIPGGLGHPLNPPAAGPADRLSGAPGVPGGLGHPLNPPAAGKIDLPPLGSPLEDLGTMPASSVPSLYSDAAAKSKALLDAPSPWSQEELQKTIDFGTKKYQQEFEERGKQITQQAIGQGLWWSGDREGAIFRNLGKFNKDVAENVVVPLTVQAINQRQADQRANIGQAADIGRGEFDIGQTANLNNQTIKASEASLTGQYRRDATSAGDLGIDVSRIYQADGSADFAAFGRIADSLKARFKEVMGREGTESELMTLIRGGKIQGAYVPTLGEKSLGLEAGMALGDIGGQETLEYKQAFGFNREVTDPVTGAVSTQHVYGSNEIQQALQIGDQQFQEKIAAGFDYVDLVTKEVRHVKGTQEFIEDTRNGYDEPVLNAQGKLLLDPQGNPIMKHVEGAQELSARLSDREADLREQGLSMEDAHFRSNQEWAQRQYTGFYQVRQVTAKDLGLSGSMDLFTSVDGSADLDAFFRWADNPRNSELYGRLRSALGRNPTSEDLNRLINGEGVAVKDTHGQPIVDWINGTVGLEQARNELARTMQDAGFTHDGSMRAAEEDYNDKVRNGYWSVGKNGEQSWIRGTQSDQEYLLTLQNTHQVSREEAQRMWEEQQRVGYDKVVRTSHWDAAKAQEVWDTHVIHVEGTQDFAKSQADDAATLTREGWAEQAAQNEASRQQQDNLEWGYFRSVPDPSSGGVRSEWVPGRQDHQDRLQQMQNDLVAKGWEADAARDQAQYIRSMATKEAGFLRQTYLQQRAWYYQNVGENGTKLSAEAAYAKAETDWTATESAFDGGKTLTERLEGMRMAADEARFDAETARMDREAIIGAIAGIVGVVGKELLLALFPEGAAGAAVGLTAEALRAAGITDQTLIDQVLGLTAGGGVEGWTQGAGGVWRNADGSTWSAANGWVDATGHGRSTAGQQGPWDAAAAQQNTRWGEEWTNKWGAQTGKQQLLSFLGGTATGMLQSAGQNTQAYADWKAKNPYKAALLDVSGGVVSFVTTGPWGVLGWTAARMFSDDAKMPSWAATVDPNVAEGLINWSAVPKDVAATSQAQSQTRLTFDFAKGEVHYLRSGQEVGKESFADFQKNQGVDLIPIKAMADADPDLRSAMADMPSGTTHVAVKRDGWSVRVTYINGTNGSALGSDEMDNYEPMFTAYLGSNKTVATKLKGLDRTILRRVSTGGTLPAEYVGLWQSIPKELKNPAAGDNPRPATMAADLMDWSGIAGGGGEVDPLTGQPGSKHPHLYRQTLP